MLNGVRKTDKPNFVVVFDGRKGEECCNLGGDFCLRLSDTAERGRSTHIHNQHHDEFALFQLKLLYRDVPLAVNLFQSGLRKSRVHRKRLDKDIIIVLFILKNRV